MATLWGMQRRCQSLAVLVIVMVFSVQVIAQSDTSEDDTLQNPVIDTNFPDPFILEVDDTYFAYSTGSGSRNVPVATSTDLVNWELVRDVMPGLARWVNISRPDVWAPEVIQIDDQFLLYYTARDKTYARQCIGVAISDAPEGPFRDQNETPFVCQADQGGTIDASPFRDDDGTLYLYYKNDGNCCMMPTYIYVQPLAADGLGFTGEPVPLLRNDQPWEGGVIEAPTMWQREDNYYLFYSGNVYATERYAVGYAVCESAMGPCEDAEENPILASNMSSQPLVVGPGHQTIVLDEAGDTWLVYHIWQLTNGGQITSNREVWMDRLIWNDDIPTVQGPTREEQAAPNVEDE